MHKNIFIKMTTDKTKLIGNNLKSELKRYDCSEWNHGIPSENWYYNGISGGVEFYDHVYNDHLQRLYNDYFIGVDEKVDLLAVSADTKSILTFLQREIGSFNESKNYQRRLDDYKRLLNPFKRSDQKQKSTQQVFFHKMIHMQLYFIDETIKKLTQVYETYNIKHKQIQERNINIEELKPFFIHTFKGAGNGNDSHFDTLIEELKAERTGKQVAQIAFLIYGSAQMSKARKPNSFAKWHKIFCKSTDYDYVEYKPNALKKDFPQKLRTLFYYLEK